jgi:hypothetical protein
MCVGSHDLCTWRLRNLAFARGGSVSVAFLTLGARVLTTPGWSDFEVLSRVVIGFTVTFPSSACSFLDFLLAPMALIFFTVSSRNRICRVAFLRRAVTVGVLSSTICNHCQQPHRAQVPDTNLRFLLDSDYNIPPSCLSPSAAWVFS